MEHKKPPFLAPGGASLPGDGCPHSPDGRSSGQARQVASAGASGRPDRGRIHLWPEETAMGARAKPGPGQDQATRRRRPLHLQTWAMCDSRELLLLWFLVLAVGGTEHVFRPGRRVCAIGAPRGPESESFVQRVYQPFLTTCDGHRACSTYRTIYRTAYRHSSGPASPRPRYACCPGWKRTSGHPMACGAAICQPPCQNGGSCVQPGRCHCPAGWQGNTCQTDVDECSAGGSSCPQCCVNTAGSYWCQCREGHNPSTDGVLCLPERGTPRVAPNPTAGKLPACPSQSLLLCLGGGPEGHHPVDLCWAVGAAGGHRPFSPGERWVVIPWGHCGEGHWGGLISAMRVEESPYPGSSLCPCLGSWETPRLCWRRDIITFGTRCDTSNSYRE
uniref:Epidermal growth factor-like protein 7 n=1 Tax=Canis lupus familiaris TaxID=9615 RepID=A0A8C0MAT9_CANLF